MAYPTAPYAAPRMFGVDIGNGSEPEQWSPDLDPDDLRELQEAELDPSKIVAKLPSEAARLGYFSTLCLIFNRMIGKTTCSHGCRPCCDSPPALTLR